MFCAENQVLYDDIKHTYPKNICAFLYCREERIIVRKIKLYLLIKGNNECSLNRKYTQHDLYIYFIYLLTDCQYINIL